ncbi:MAG: ImmA/IrrE family metallo-endopeptidase [candidate division NC10 bacterium]|nr:ImmA/IrrE family metallo-endopeptidase [candidate division NC10 bacterium]MBI2458295.1 ImmA/IrrE family metallo-endopeptidase [candidate division NC10 bacterium]
MKQPQVPRYGLPKLESLAQTLLRERWPALAIPVDIDYLTEQEPDVVLDTERGLRDRFGVPGATVYHPKENRFTVLIDEAVADGNPGFFRFTVAEELGHVRLHRAILRSVRTMEDAVALQTSDGYQFMDRNAKWFASALLMPRDPLLRDAKKIYADLVKQHGFGRPELIRRALVIRLGQRYVVNVSPMEYRLRNWPLAVLKLVDHALEAKMNSLP